MAEKKQALDGKRRNMFDMDPDELCIVGRDTEDGPEHALWRASALEGPEPDKVASIKEVGIIQSVAVMKTEVTIKGKKVVRTCVAAGRGRTIAARELKRAHGWEGEVPCVVFKGDAGVQLSIAATENHVRRQPDPLELADDAVRFSNMGWDKARIAARLGVKPSRVADLLKVQELAAPVKKAISEGAVSVTAAATLSDLPKGEQAAKLDELKGGSGDKPAKRATVREVRKAVAKAAGREAVQVMSGKQLEKALEVAEAYGSGGGSPEERARARGARDALLLALGRQPKVADELTKAIREAVSS